MSRRDWLAAAVITVVAVAIAAFLLRDPSGDPEPRSESGPPSARIMSAASADQLVRELSRRGWDCYDSLPDPVVRRCFLDEVAGDGGTATADVALTYADGYVARVNVYAAGERDDGRHVEIAEQTARLAGDVLLDGAGSVLVDHLGVRDEIEIAGRLVYGNRSPGSSVQVVVESASYDGRSLPPPNFPALAELVAVAEAGGLVCQDYGATTTCADSGTPGMTVTVSTAAGRIGSLTLSASSYAVPNDPAVVTMVSGYLYETGIGGPPASAWLRTHADSSAPVQADLGGVHLRLRGGDDHTVYLNATEIGN